VTPQLRYQLVLDLARVLFVNGQATEQTVMAVERFGRAIGLRVTVMLRWGATREPTSYRKGTRIRPASTWIVLRRP
jgi:hypothetical protein